MICIGIHRDIDHFDPQNYIPLAFLLHRIIHERTSHLINSWKSTKSQSGLTRRTCVVHRVVVAGKRRESNDETQTENKGRYRESNYKRIASFRTLFLFLAVLNFFEPIPSPHHVSFHRLFVFHLS